MERLKPLMRAAAIEVMTILDQHFEQMSLAEHDDVVQALAAHAAQKPLAKRVGTP